MSGKYIIELRQVANLIKVSAADPETLKEVSLVFPADKNISREYMCKMAVHRLEYVLKKESTPIG
jgi:hypothetical protein